VQHFITTTVGWFYHVTVTFLLAFCGWLAASRFGKIRLGPDEAEPKYSYVTWFAMLFAAGMGIGVLFWSVAEPLTHFMNPPTGTGGTAEAARTAMSITLLHWGLHGWGVYVVVGLSLAYFSFRRGLPLTLRSAFASLLGERVNGPFGHAIDIFAVLGTMFGVATSLGLGAQQINSGLSYLGGVPEGTGTQLLLIAGVTTLATISVVSGLDRGIRRLSELTVYLAAAVFLYVLLTGPTSETLRVAATSIGHYVIDLVSRLFWSSPGGSIKWQADWTLFYWGWWIAWSPFVGMFVARISRGRTIREFVLGVLLVPSLVTAVWFSIFGGMALHKVLLGDRQLARAVKANFPVAIFVFFNEFPFPTVLSVVGTILITVFFVTSSDSASLVIDYLTGRPGEEPPKRQRIFWATGEGVVGAVLLVAGGLSAMRTFQIVTGLPLAGVLLVMCYALVHSLRQERATIV
jgi:choline/glycine/proline betaine transport protein